ncbi:class I SAM-dependent methyltransferase [Methanoregula sp.]|uniref:class I SAM-dependent methyltransferase n=1 Tax=Methanoregula sp. TaxID=2052170 RepID=UPI002D0C918A|nr:methyltransferase domain-containing protein [Methanoregula sp.]HVP95618.1 methyltransferase domain-containing protein [Methanoregula sp.]
MPPHSHARDVFSVEKAAHLDTNFRRFLYRPDRLAERYVKPGDRVLDFGCGPGFFTREFAKRVGEKGVVISADLQEGMLEIVRTKMEAEGFASRVQTHRCQPDSLALSPEKDGQVDAAFAIFVVHEVPDREKLFREITAMLAPGGIFFYSEPPFLVSGKEFRENLALLEKGGLCVVETRWYFVNRAAVLRKV